MVVRSAAYWAALWVGSSVVPKESTLADRRAGEMADWRAVCSAGRSEFHSVALWAWTKAVWWVDSLAAETADSKAANLVASMAVHSAV